MNRFNLRTWLLAALCAYLVAELHADAGRGRHQQLYAVPVKGKVTVDGQLDDWDLSGQIWIYVISETADMQSARFAMMYDADALYISGVVRDSSPMMNRHDPNVDPERAWDADVCQVFMNLDPSMGYPVTLSKEVIDRMATLYLWYYTDRQEACLAMLGGMSFTEPYRKDLNPKGVIPHDKFQAAYRKAADGRGYTFEYRIPFATLGMKNVPKANDILATTTCFFWGTPDGLKTAGGAAWAYDVMAHAGFPWQDSTCWGKVIFSAKAQLPKELVEEGLPPEKPLPLTFDYDLPEDSHTSIQLFDEKGLLVRTLVAEGERRAGRNVERWDGLDVFGKPIEPGKYVWKGVYYPAITTKFLFSVHNSGQPPYHTDDNTGSWGGDHGNPTAVCAAGDSIVMTWGYCEAGFGIINTDLTGKKRWGNKHNASDVATDGQRIFVVGDAGYEGANSVKIFEVQDGRPLNWGNGQPALTPPAADSVATGVANGNGRVYVSWATNNFVGAYDAVSGDLKDKWTVTVPGRLAMRPDGSVAVISEARIVAVKDGHTSVFIADHLDDPRGIAVGPDGTTYVANAGKLQNVVVFDPSGKYVRSIGKPGGRPAVGRYDRSGIYEPGGIALDKNGHLWVAETTDSPKRISEWDATSGALVNEFFGGSAYFGWAYMDPRRPDEIYCHGLIWKVDWQDNTAAPLSTIWRATKPNVVPAPDPGALWGPFRVFTAKNGHQYGCGGNWLMNILYSREGDVFKPFAADIELRRVGYGSGLPMFPVMRDPAKYPDGVYVWQDANNDQTVQENEITRVTGAGITLGAFHSMDADLNAYGTVYGGESYMLKPVRVEADGRPVYDITKREPLLRPDHPQYTWQDERDGSWYSFGGNSDLAHYTPTGQRLWAYRGSVDWHYAINLPPLTPGNMNGLTMPLGTAGGFTGAASYFGVFNLITTDGVYVAQCFRDGRLGGLGPDVLNSETVIGQLVKPDGMDRYFFLGGAADGRVTEILGLDKVKRLRGGEYMFTKEDAQKAADGLREYQALLAKSQRLTIVRGRATLADAKPVGKTADEQRSFSARCAYDEKNLYVQFDVNSPNELLNAASDPRLVFKGGNLLDIQLATDPSADPSRKTPVPGDIRLLVTRRDGKPFAMLYRPKVKGFHGEPIVLHSPTGQESFDAIEPVDVGLEYTKTPSGFHAVVTVPLERLGWKPQPGQTVKIDLGYIYGNALGTQTALRSYWHDTGFSAGVVADVPNEARMEPNQWGTATVE